MKISSRCCTSRHCVF